MLSQTLAPTDSVFSAPQLAASLQGYDRRRFPARGLLPATRGPVWPAFLGQSPLPEPWDASQARLLTRFLLFPSLLALGLKHFEGTEFPKSLISKYLLTTKTAHQLTVRIKNLNMNRVPDNILKVSGGRAPRRAEALRSRSPDGGVGCGLQGREAPDFSRVAARRAPAGLAPPGSGSKALRFPRSTFDPVRLLGCLRLGPQTLPQISDLQPSPCHGPNI